MKCLIFISILTIFLPALTAQNYECIKPATVQHFSADPSSFMVSIRIDSVRQYGDSSFFYNYYMLRPSLNSSSEWTNKGNSWTGSKTIQLPADKWMFFNGNNDTIYIDCGAGLNDNWRFCTLADGSYYTATVADFCEEIFIGITDSVKTLSIQKFDSTGQPIASPANNMEIAISKNFGMVKLINFDAFEFVHPYPYFGEFNDIATLQQFFIAGMTSPQVGWQNITAYEVYGSNYPGDEIHYSYGSQDYLSYNNEGMLAMLKFIARNEFNNGDSISYIIDRCYYYRRYETGNTTRYYVHDTIARGFNLATSALNILSMEPYCSGNMLETYLKYHNNVSNCQLMLYECSENSQFIIFDGSVWIEYIPFLWDFTYTGQGLTATCESSVTYYRINGNEWGNPYSCDSLHALGINISKTENRINIYPNPVSDVLIIEGAGNIKNISLEISDVTGRTIRYSTDPSEPRIVYIGTLSAGLYSYRISENGIVLKTGRFIKN
jgi:hypothetical protein